MWLRSDWRIEDKLDVLVRVVQQVKESISWQT